MSLPIENPQFNNAKDFKNRPPYPEARYLQPTARELALKTLLITDFAEPTEPHTGSNSTKLVIFQDKTRAVFKAGKLERPLIEFRETHGLLYKREIAAYMVDKYWNLGLIPTTVEREVFGFQGSLQEFVPNTIEYSKLDNKIGIANQLFITGIFDYIIWNKDRNRSHFRLTEANNRKLYGDETISTKLIDNGLSFDAWPLHPTFYLPDNLREHVYGKPVPEDFRCKTLKLYEDEKRQNMLRNELNNLLPNPAVDAFFARFNLIGDLMKKKHTIQRGDIEILNNNDEGHEPKYEPIYKPQ